ncbi:MAG: FG-GAP-like repeat-containing protein [Planctomycetota bacterium]
MFSARRAYVAWGLLLFTLIAGSGCNAGLGALISGLSGSSSSSSVQSPSAVSAFTVLNTKTSPAVIRFVLTDADGDDVEVELLYELPDGTTHSITALQGATNPATYASSGSGTTHDVVWDFTSEPGFDPSGSFIDGITVFGQILNASGPPTALIAGATAAVGIGLGNDAPVVQDIVVPATEIAGVVPFTVTLSDSSADLVSIRVEYDVEGADSWQLARPAGTMDTPDLAIVGLSAPPGGVTFNFFWDANNDLPLAEHRIRLRLTAMDDTATADPVVSDEFRIDNNSQSIVDLDNGLVALSASDTSGGIAVPFTVIDAEGDNVRIVLQWRRPGESFPTLPTDDPAAVFAIQDDPALRAEYQVCSQRVSFVEGRPETVSPTQLRLPALGTSAISLATPALVGRDLQLLRPTERAEELTPSWSTNPLTNPVAAHPIGDGLEAIVLDEPAADSWRIQRIEVATGAVIGVVASGTGTPTALAISSQDEVAFVATSDATAWHLHRLDIESGSMLPAATGALSGGSGIRGIASATEHSAFATIDDSVAEIRFSTTPPSVATVVTGLALPWGVAVDPQDRRRVFVAENGADRIVVIDRSRHTVTDALTTGPSPGSTFDPLSFPAPRGIAIDRSGVRLVAITEPTAGARELRAMNLRSPHDLDGSGFANQFAYILTQLPVATSSALATGRHNLRLVTAPSGLTVIGGIEQRRTIVDAPAIGNVVTLDAPLDPPLVASRTWRVKRSTNIFKATATGASHTFAWDSRDLPAGGSVLFRALPFDSELGLVAETTAEKTTVSGIVARLVTVDNTLFSPVVDATVIQHFFAPDIVDFDQDGDLDIVISDGQESRVRLQQGRGHYLEAAPITAPLGESLGVRILCADLDASGATDIVHVRADGDIEIAWGTGPNTFEAEPAILTNPIVPGETTRLATLATTDTNGDGLLDLLVSIPSEPSVQLNDATLQLGGISDVVLLYEQANPGSFSPTPKTIGGPSITVGTRDMALADIDGDGALDVVFANDGDLGLSSEDPGNISVHFQDANGDFDVDTQIIGEEDPFFTAYLTTSAVRCVAAGDLDGDGDVDIVAGHGRFSVGQGPIAAPQYSRRVTVFWQTAPRVFDPTPLELFGAEASTGAVMDVDVADMNRDGRLDIIAQGTSGVHYFLANGTGTFEAPLTLPYEGMSAVGFYSEPNDHLAIADIDGDGDLDTLYRDRSNNTIVMVLQTVEGIEALSPPLSLMVPGVTDGTSDAVVADLDADGDLDVATANSGLFGIGASNNFQIFLQSAPRTFVSTPIELGDPIAAAVTTRVEAADMDQDGDNDLIGLSSRGNRIDIWFQEQPGVFGDSLTLDGAEPSPFNPLINVIDNLLIQDYDRDGVLEMVTMSNQTTTILGFDATTPGQYQQSFRFDVMDDQGLPAVTAPETCTVFDADADGDLELLVAATGVGTSGSFLYTFTATSPGVFDPGPAEEPGRSVSAFADVDMNGDGLVDLITVEPLPNDPFGTAAIAINFQNATGGFDSITLDEAPVQGPFLFGDQPRVKPVDFDRDGDLDLAFLRPTGPTILAAGNGSVWLYEQLAPGLFASPRVIVEETVAVGAALRIDDIDGDGELDIALPRSLQADVSGLRVLWGNE